VDAKDIHASVTAMEDMPAKLTNQKISVTKQAKTT
jgi:hypothetical protein